MPYSSPEAGEKRPCEDTGAGEGKHSDSEASSSTSTAAALSPALSQRDEAWKKLEAARAKLASIRIESNNAHVKVDDACEMIASGKGARIDPNCFAASAVVSGQVAAATIELQKAAADFIKVERVIEEIRQRIRERGGVEHDSLLVVGEDAISSVVTFLDAWSISRCEMTCTILKKLSAHTWVSLDAAKWRNGSQADAARTRAIKYHLASELAVSVAPLVSNHERDCASMTTKCSGCNSFPSQLIWQDVFDHPEKYEVFMQISVSGSENTTSASVDGDGSDRMLLSEGFVPFRATGAYIRIDIADCDLSSWPAMRDLQALDGGMRHADWGAKAKKAFPYLTVVTLVAAQKSSLSVGLVSAMTNFHIHEVIGGYYCPFASGENYLFMETHTQVYDDESTSVSFCWEETNPPGKQFQLLCGIQD